MAWLRSNWQGLVLCLIISVPAYYLGVLVPVVGGPVFAILIGMILALVIHRRENLQPGVNFTSKKILQWAVIVLGFGMDLADVLLTGSRSFQLSRPR